MVELVMPGQSILIIDDEPNQRFMLEQALRLLDPDWQIATAATGQEALDLLAQRTPNLIITDYHMPAMNGLELIGHIRARQIDSRVILMTAYSSPELHEAARQLHIDHYLTKPVPLTLLRRLTLDTLRGQLANS